MNNKTVVLALDISGSLELDIAHNTATVREHAQELLDGGYKVRFMAFNHDLVLSLSINHSRDILSCTGNEGGGGLFSPVVMELTKIGLNDAPVFIYTDTGVFIDPSETLDNVTWIDIAEDVSPAFKQTPPFGVVVPLSSVEILGLTSFLPSWPRQTSVGEPTLQHVMDELERIGDSSTLQAVRSAVSSLKTKREIRAPISGPTVISEDGTERPLDQVFHVKDYQSIGMRTFLCPSCGGRWFRTAVHYAEDPAQSIRVCKDQLGLGCEWRGPLVQALDPEEDLYIHPILRSEHFRAVKGQKEDITEPF